jgi:hypothetical protein
VATGTNRFLGQPLSNFGAPLGTAGFYNVGVYNPSGSQPLALGSDTPLSALLATRVDPGFLALFGKTLADVNPTLLNLPLRDVHVNSDLAGIQRVPTTSILQAQQLQPSQAEPGREITLADWIRARGVAVFKCEDGFSKVTLDLSGLIPNRVYTVWGIFGGDSMTPFPLGGVPNVMVTDSRGNAEFERELNFCPRELTPGQRPLLVIDVVYHSDNQVYGFVPELDLAGYFTGTTTHTQLEFLVTGTPIR